MTDVSVLSNTLPEMTTKEVAVAQAAQDFLLTKEQVDLPTYHTLHGGVYTRTIQLLAGEALVGALIKIPTTLVISGHIKVFIGGMVHEIDGFKVIPASAYRKQTMIAIANTQVTMLFPTTAKTIKDAEDEFTDESALLMSRQDTAINVINITKDNACQERYQQPFMWQQQ